MAAVTQSQRARARPSIIWLPFAFESLGQVQIVAVEPKTAAKKFESESEFEFEFEFESKSESESEPELVTHLVISSPALQCSFSRF